MNDARETALAMACGFMFGAAAYSIATTALHVWRLSKQPSYGDPHGDGGEGGVIDMDGIRASQGAEDYDNDDDELDGDEWKRAPRRRRPNVQPNVKRPAVRPKELDDPDRRRNGGGGDKPKQCDNRKRR